MINNTTKLIEYVPRYIISSTGKKFTLNSKIERSFLYLWYSTPTYNKSGKTHGYKSFSFTLPQSMLLDKLTSQVIGLFVAELYTSYAGKVRVHNPQISFVNSEPNNINSVLTWFERLGVSRDKWKWRVQLNRKFKLLDSTKQHEARKLAAKKFWVEQTEISEEMAYPTIFNYVGTEKGEIRPHSPPWGTLIIDFGNNILKNVITTLTEKVSKEIELSDDKQFVAWYLSGIISGEADVTSLVNRIGIGAKRNSVKENIKKCLRIIGVTPAKDSETRVRVFNIKNMLQFYKFGMLTLHPKKYSDFLNLLLSVKGRYKNLREMKELRNLRHEIEQKFKDVSEFINRRLNYFNLLMEEYLKVLK